MMAGFFDYNDDPMGAGLLAAAQGLLTPRDQGGGLGAAFGGFGRAAAEARQRQLDAELKRLQIDASRKAQKSQRYISAGGGMMFDTETGSYLPLPSGSEKNNLPDEWRNWLLYDSLSPEKKRDYLDRKRGNYGIVDIAGVPTMVGRAPPQLGGATVNPLSSLGQEAAAASTLARSKGFGAEAGKVDAEYGAKRPEQSRTALNILDDAESLIQQATGSWVGAGRDIGLEVIGQSTPAGRAAAQLKVVQANLMTNQPRMEGPQSDRDVQLYKEMAGRIGDPMAPTEIKLDALKTIRSLHEKYANRGADVPAGRGQTSSRSPSPSKTDPLGIR